jgi:hypothetical protein
MLHRSALFAFAALLASGATADAIECGLSSFSLSAGRTYRKADFPPSGRLFYPEVKLGGPLLFSRVQWGVSWGYWNEDKEQLSGETGNSYPSFPVESQQESFSRRGHVLGARLTVFPHRSGATPVAVGLFAGASRHFLRENYIRSTSGGQQRGIRNAPSFSTFDLGVTTFFRLAGPFALVGELRLLQPFDGTHTRYDAYRNRLAFTAGAAWFPK